MHLNWVLVASKMLSSEQDARTTYKEFAIIEIKV